MSITANRLPWRWDLNVFMTPISHVNWNTNTVDSICIRNGYKRNSGAQNDSIGFDVTLAKGTWTFEMLHYMGQNNGIYTVALDGTTVGTIDGRADPAAPNTRSQITGIAVSTTSKKRLTITTATKNPSSGGYTGAIQHIQLRRTA